MSQKRLPCVIDGVHYKSEHEANKALGIATGTLRSRLLSSGFPNYISKCHTKRTVKRRLFACSIAGIEYRSINAASKKLKLSSDAIRRRLASLDYPDFVCAHILKKPFKKRDRKTQRPCCIDGIEYKSMKAASTALGISITGLRTRLRSSNFPEYISKHHPKIQHKKVAISCSIRGIEYASITDAARRLKISYTALSNRLSSCNYPDYVCADIPKKSRKPLKYSYVVNGKKYRTLQEIADMEGVTREWIRQKMNNPSYRKYKRFERAKSRNR